MLEYSMTFWIASGILSCLIFTLSNRDMVRCIEIVDALMLLIVYTCFVLLGPIGLVLILIAWLLVFLTDR
jgi:hypothetical protein